jgi:hypothetical protein
VATEIGEDVTACDAEWLVPGSPYADDAAVVASLAAVREGGTPFLGTCGGLLPIHPLVRAFVATAP